MSCLAPERRGAAKEGCSGLDIKNTSRRRRSGDFLCQSQKNIPSPHVRLWQATRTDPLVDGTLFLKRLPRMKAHENINRRRPDGGGDGL